MNLFRVNDIILSVNGVTMVDVTHAESVQALKQAGKTVILVCNYNVSVYLFVHLVICFFYLFNLFVITMLVCYLLVVQPLSFLSAKRKSLSLFENVNKKLPSSIDCAFCMNG